MMIRRIINDEVLLGCIPPWWMGRAYHDYECARTIYWIVPLHHVVQFAWWINWKWCAYCHRHSWIDRQVCAAVRREVFGR